jgi:hypothetical protein
VTASQDLTFSPSKDWIAGVALEFHIHSRLSLEVDGMYRELHAAYAGIEPNGTLTGAAPFRVVTWEIPVLAKYRLGAGKLQPFVEAGPSIRATGNLNFNPSHRGATVGIGVETQWRGLSIAPTLRYTRWAQDQYFARSQLNQVELLVEVSRASESYGSPLGQRISVGAIAGWGLTNDVSSYTENFTYATQGTPPEPATCWRSTGSGSGR